MTARPPPARPHIGLNPTTKFSSYAVNNDWGEDDAWDSASDSESPSKADWKRSGNARASSSTTTPKPVPRPTLNNSSSTLAFSYTHVATPSSYPPKEKVEQPSKNGWTIVRKSTERGSLEGRELNHLANSAVYDELDADMVIGEMESEADERAGASSGKPRYGQGVLRDDAQEIVDGAPIRIVCSH